MTTKDDVFNSAELDAIDDAKEAKEERNQKQQEFIEAVADESDSEELETQVELAPEITVTVRGKLNGEIIDRLGHVQERMENAEAENRLYDISDAVDDACQLLADVVDDPRYDKDVFYQVYQNNGPEDIGRMLRRCFESLQAERERLSGEADGFRKE